MKIDSKKLLDFIYDASKKLEIDAISVTCSNELVESEKKNFPHELLTIHENFSDYRVVITAGLSYNFNWNNISSDTIGFIAHYTTANYYKILYNALKKLAILIKEKFDIRMPNKKFYKIFVNSMLNDKLLAGISGLGEYSRNSLINIANLGQKCVLGELLLLLDMNGIIENKAHSKLKLASECTNCNVCIKSCPTASLKDIIVDKDHCIQRLSGELVWPIEINGMPFIKIWGQRFFGCTLCLDKCPINKNAAIKKYDDNSRPPGYIGTKFEFEEIFNMKKDDYKIRFNNNQLSRSWIPVLALLRNSIAGLFNMGKYGLIKNYLNNLEDYCWDENEKKYIRDFVSFYLRLRI